MKVGAVTVTYNSSHVIEPFLASMVQQTFQQWSLYVIDNASHDNTRVQVTACSDPRIRLLANSENLGIAEANNQGIRQALEDNCDAVLLLNNDTEFEPGLLDKLVEGLSSYRCEMIAPKILFYHDRTIWSAGGGMDSRRAYSGFHYGYAEKDVGQYDDARPVDHAPACCLLIHKEVFARIGLMDTHYFTYVEDTDFCYRAKRAGIKLMYLPSATLLHKAHSLTGGLFSDFMIRYTTRNRVYFMLKHFGLLGALCYLPAYQAHLLFQLVSRKANLSMFCLRERAFYEGLAVWRHSLSR